MTVISYLTGLPPPPPCGVTAMDYLVKYANAPIPMGADQFRGTSPLEKEPPKNELVEHELSWPQYHFVTSRAKFPAMVAGYGAGKTEAAILRALRFKLDYPPQNVGYYLPTYDLIKQIVFPRMEQLLTAHGYAYSLNETDKTLQIYGMEGLIIFRTMDAPERIIGYEHADAICDELDTLKTDKAADVWRKVVARNRQKKPDGKQNTIGVATTPEGFKFVYQKWRQKPLIGSQVIRASTSSNAKNLPADYIDTLKNNYPDQMLLAYLEGEFVNLTQGSVYAGFDRVLNGCNTRIEPDETLHIGVDFNVGAMAAAVHVLRDGVPHAVAEHTGLLDTPALITTLKNLYQNDALKAARRWHRIICYPDASGKSRKSVNASVSDIALLKQAGFLVLAKSTNPFVKDRVAAMNKQICKNEKRLYKVNVDACPHLVEGLEKQAYDKNGEPDKTSGLDHIIDAAGYFISYRFPVVYGKAVQTRVTGT